MRTTKIFAFFLAVWFTSSAWALDVRPASDEPVSTVQRYESDAVSFELHEGQVATRQMISSEQGVVEQWVVSFVDPTTGERGSDVAWILQIYPDSSDDHKANSQRDTLSENILASLEKQFGITIDPQPLRAHYQKMGSATGYQFVLPSVDQYVAFVVKKLPNGYGVVLTQTPTENSSIRTATDAWLNSIAFGQTP